MSSKSWILGGLAGLALVGAIAVLLTPSIFSSLIGHLTPRSTGASRAVVVVVGSGLAGTVAAITAARAAAGGVDVVVLEKEERTGGNSAKASSGINALSPEAGDSAELFRSDTLQAGSNVNAAGLVDVLVGESRQALAFLEEFGLDLNSSVQLGGHSCRRTHANTNGPNVGYYITSKLAEHLSQLNNARVLVNAQVQQLRRSGGRYLVTYETQPDGATHTLPADAVVLATGGFGASKQLLGKHAPQVADLATTNGPFAVGDGLKLAQSAGAQFRDLDKVQVHPTGFVDPADPDSRTKFLAPEKLRGVGAVLLDAYGHRFVNELSTRDVVSAAVLAQPAKQAWLVLDSHGAEQFGPMLKFYLAKGLVDKMELDGLADRMGVPSQVLRDEAATYAAAAMAGTDGFGKGVFPSSLDVSQPLYVAKITPVVHYCMGGVAIDSDAEVLDESGTPIAGLFAAGEVAGGVHGSNRLGGNSLLECVVFGMHAGSNALAHAALSLRVEL